MWRGKIHAAFGCFRDFAFRIRKKFTEKKENAKSKGSALKIDPNKQSACE